MMNPTLRDVARHARVSVTTASRVLSGSSHPVSAEVRERVERIAGDLGFTPNAYARGLSKRDFRLIGLVIPDVRDPYFVEIARGAEDVANQHGYMAVLCNTDRDPVKEQRYVAELRAMRAGIILTGGAISSEAHLQELTTHPAPMVVIGRHELPCSAVEIANLQGAVDATTHLIELGHRRIAFIGGPLTSTTAADRLEGFRQAMVRHDLTVDEDLVFDSDFTIEGGESRMRQLMESGKLNDALFAASDHIAIGAMQAAKRRGLSIPRALSIVGFNDIATASLVDPPLTTIHLPLRRIGRTAAEMLIEQARSGGAETSSVVVKGELVIRESTAPRHSDTGQRRTQRPRRPME